MVNIIKHPLMPFDETRLASSLETKKEVSIHTGEKVHCLKKDNTLYVSNELYQKILLV